MVRAIKPGLVVLFLLMQALVNVSWSKDLYVMDVIYITLRSGQGDEFKVLKTLKSGSKLELIQEGDDKHSLVRAEDGTEGWVQHRFLVDEPIAAQKLETALVELDRVKSENDQLKEKIGSVRGNLKETEQERKRLESMAQRLQNKQDKLEKVAAKPIQLDAENSELRTKNAALQKEVNELRNEISGLTDQSGRSWFLTGAGVIIAGILIGLVVPRLRLRKSSSWA